LPERVAQRLTVALATAGRESAPAAETIAVLRMLARSSWRDVQPIATACLRPRRPAEVQRAALELIGRFDEPDGAAAILAAWSTLTPPVRATAADILLSRSPWRGLLLDAVDAGTIRRGDLDPAHVQQLLRTPDNAQRTRAAALFAGASSSERLAIVERYRAALKGEGKPERGREIFRRACASCHRLDHEGTAVGPDLATIRGQSAESVLLNILDPNREVLPKYFLYNLTTNAGVTIAGMLLDESPASVTIRRIDGTTVTVSRLEMESLVSTGVSAMPEGLESQIDVVGMADLLAYLLKPR
jgi:putative heme-binding domain-containing protein